MEDNSRNDGRTSDGRFAVGNKFRVHGARNRATQMAEMLFDGAAEEICNAVIDAAKSGDMVRRDSSLNASAHLARIVPFHSIFPRLRPRLTAMPRWQACLLPWTLAMSHPRKGMWLPA
jgi:hypothetical protein